MSGLTEVHNFRRAHTGTSNLEDCTGHDDVAQQQSVCHCMILQTVAMMFMGCSSAASGDVAHQIQTLLKHGQVHAINIYVKLSSWMECVQDEGAILPLVRCMQTFQANAQRCMASDRSHHHCHAGPVARLYLPPLTSLPPEHLGCRCGTHESHSA